MRVMRGEREEGKAGEAIRSLYVLCGEAVIRQIVVVAAVCNGYGSCIFEGLRRLFGARWVFVVKINLYPQYQYSIHHTSQQQNSKYK